MHIPTLESGRERGSRSRPPASLRAAVGALVIVLGISVSAVAQTPEVPGVGVVRVGDDLVISWSAPASPVDGYRVYEATDAACGSVSLMYAGTATTYTVVGAMSDQSASMYAVAAFIGAAEGPRSFPIYKYPFEMPATIPGASNHNVISVPDDALDTGVTVSHELCFGLNGGSYSGEPIRHLLRHRTDSFNWTTQNCGIPSNFFEQDASDAYSIWPSFGAGAATVMVWGKGADLPVELDVAQTTLPDCRMGLHFVSLPWDHAYPDLQSIADEIPEALMVAMSDPSVLGYCETQDQWLVGIRRDTTQDPWTGPNTSLAGLRAHGVVITVETPTSWTPRRLCEIFGGPPPVNVAPVADAGGPYDQTMCNGGVLGIWLDGTASFDPDQTGTLSYEWTTTCSGSIDSPTSPLTTVSFTCSPCIEDMCDVSLRVTDGGGASTVSSTAVTTRRLPGCLTAPNNGLRVTQFAGDPNLTFDWTRAPSAQNYLLLTHENRSQLIPHFMTCGPEQMYFDPDGTSAVEFFRVEAFDAPCGPR